MPDQQPNLPSAFNPGEWRPPREMFARRGYLPPTPDSLDDRQLAGRLWEMIYAAAARNFYFHHTNHLSDRQLYRLLHDEWLSDPTADLPPGSDWNCTIALSEFNAHGDSYQETFLRYYASDEERQNWQRKNPRKPLPSHENPPFDRDRFLPAPPPEAMNETGEDALGASSEPEFDSEVEKQLRESEPENWRPTAQQLTEQNVPLLPPAEITDETLTPILWELIHNLALRGFYLLHTDHLSDRELYAELWTHGLRDPAYLPGRNPHGGWFHDFLGSGGEAETQLWLRYYASDQERIDHAKENPTETLPAKQKSPFDRDWRLPKGPF